MPPLFRTSASPATFSGGNTGSSSQRRPSGASRRAISIASTTVHGQFVSSMIRAPVPATSRAAFTSGTVISCSLMSR